MKHRSDNQNLQILGLYLKHAWKHKRLVIALYTLVPLAMLAFRFLPPLVLAQVLQRISSGDYARSGLVGDFGGQLLIYSLIVLIGGVLVWRLAIIVIWKLEMRVIQDIHQRIFDHLMRLSADFHADRFGGSLVSQANKFAGAYVRLADTFTFQTVGLVLSFVFTIVILGGKAPLVVAFLLLFSVLYMLVAVRITGTIRKLNAAEAAANNKQTGFLADAVTNIMAVKSFAAGGYESARYATATQVSRQATDTLMRASVKRDIFFSSATGILTAVSAVLAVVGVVRYGTDIATTFLVITYTGIIAQNLWEFSQQTLRNYNRGLGDAKEMAAILAIQPTVQDPAKPQAVRITDGAISFEDVVFAHEKGEALFNKLNLQVKAGEKIGLVGHSGSGKTSLTRLLLRFSDIQGGSITIDGQDISHITQDDLRKHIAYVPQEPLLFHRSLLDNIRYGRPDASDEEVRRIAALANAHDFIAGLPDGYETLVGERGVKLSGGQRQRVAIARAMLKNAPIILLDEATSALDSQSEVLIQDALWKLMEGRTAIVIAHRLSTIQKMDRIIVLDEGKIIEQGNHKHLVAAGGAYARLWNHQSGGFIEEDDVED